MASKGIQAAAFGAFGLACWFGGSYYERSRGAKIYSKPVLQTVSPVQLPSADVKTDDRLAAVAKRTSEIMRFGFPSLSNIRSFDDFILSYDTRNRVAHWVFEHLTQENLKVSQNVDRTKCDFVEDKSIHPLFRATNADYKHSGFDRGHLAPAGNHKRDQRHCDQTFTLSNIAPQVGIGFNRHAWNELEKYTRRLTNKYSDVFICTGPIYAPVYEGGKKYIKYQVLGENNVAVPTHFFKVVVMVTHDNQIHMENYLMPNTPIPEKTPLTTFLVPLETIQKLSGLLFFDETPVKSVNGKKTSFWSTIKN